MVQEHPVILLQNKKFSYYKKRHQYHCAGCLRTFFGILLGCDREKQGGVGYLLTIPAAPGSEPAVAAYGGMLITVDEGQITNIAVHPDHRRKGYGAAITRALLRHAKDAKLESVSLEVRVSNTAAIELYKKAGFAEAGRRKGFYAKPTEDALVMVCKIK